MLSLSLAVSGCAEEPLTDEELAAGEGAIEEAEELEAVEDETPSEVPDDVDEGEWTPGVVTDEVVEDEPGGVAGPTRGVTSFGFGGRFGNFTGGDVTDLSVVQEPDAEEAAKIAAATAAVAPLRPWISPRPGASPAETASARAAAAAACGRPNKKILGLTHYAQKKGFYCGPASGYMIIRYLHGASFRSRKNNAVLSQANLAKSAHMETDSRGSTPWLSKTFTKGLNAWRGNSHYTQVSKPSAQVFRGALTLTIGGSGRPVAADTVELAGGVHYNGHPVNRTIGHWIVAYGYDDCGGKAYFADPATSVWRSVKPKFSYDSTRFRNNFLKHNGIAY